MTGDLTPRLGGKGANLVRLADAGLPVPPFVIIDTAEYDIFVESAGLQPVITQALNWPAATASEKIRAAFTAAAMTPDQRDRLANLLANLISDGPVAVRSSATAEDLPGFSFAGQQDSFLNVAPDEVLGHIVDCWSSLWTERAIAYRTRNDIAHGTVSLAVIVQTMVDAAASGVLFTANPHTGLRDETVIDAAPGLGEALVSGQIIPDTFTFDTASGALRTRTLAPTPAPLTDGQLDTLVAAGRRIAALYAEPMDIEWATTPDEVFIVQARPVTNLYPLPSPNRAPHETPEVWLSFGAFQGMLEPITPLGQQMLQMMMAGAARVVGRRIDWRTNRAIQVAGERLWVRADGVMRTKMTRAIMNRFVPMADPGIAAILTKLADEPDLKAVSATPKPRTLAAVAGLMSRTVPRARAAMANPQAARAHVERVCAQFIAEFTELIARTASASTPQGRLNARVTVMERLAARFFPTVLPPFAAIMPTSMILLARIRELARKTHLQDADALAMSVMRALPGNVTTEMDLRLGDAAAIIRSDATAWGWIATTSASDLARQFEGRNLPRVAQEALDEFFADYGMRGIAEIDLGAPRWRDDPTSVMASLKAYVGVTDPAQQPRAVHLAGQHEAGRAIRTLMDASTPARRARIKTAARAIRGMFGARETPKFTIIKSFGLLRDALDASASELVAAGRLADPGDIYFLHIDELRRAFSSDWQTVVAERRARHAAESRRRQVPRVLVEDGRTFYEGLGASGDLAGQGVSPGVAEGVVRVILDPRTTTLRQGEILVCPGTDPAWTPLFLTAGGLITEVGGLMTHGAVVAREYGLPAIVGVHEATHRLADGQRIRIDGTSGVIELLER